MKSQHQICVSIIALLMLVSCQENELIYTTSDLKYHDLIVRSLDSKNIPYKLQNGEIIYSPDEQERVQGVILKVRQFTTLKFEEEEVRAYLNSLLEERNIDYLPALANSDGEVIFWPENPDIANELLERTIEYRFMRDIEAGIKSQ